MSATYFRLDNINYSAGCVEHVKMLLQRHPVSNIGHSVFMTLARLKVYFTAGKKNKINKSVVLPGNII